MFTTKFVLFQHNLALCFDGTTVIHIGAGTTVI